MNGMHESDDRYLLAAFLPVDERLALEEEARGNPAARALIEASRDIRAALGDVDRLRSTTGTGDALAFLAAARIGSDVDDRAWNDVLDTIEKRILEHPEARATYERLRRRIEELEGGSDAETHFRRLTGGPHRIIPLRSLVAAAVVVALLFGGAVAGRLTEDSVAKAAFTSLRDDLAASRAYRGDRLETVGILREAAEARHVVLGIWPVYDRDRLRELDRLLGTPNGADGWLAVARVRLMAGDRRGGKDALLRAVARGAGPKAEQLLTRVLESESE